MDIETTEQSPVEQIIENAKKSEAIFSEGPMVPKGKEGPKKRGRPAKSTQSKKEESEEKNQKYQEPKQGPKFEIPTEALCYPIVKGISVAAIGIVKDNRAGMTPDEAEGVARAMGMVLDKYMPDAMAKWGPELVLAVSLGQYGMRLYGLSLYKKDQAQKEQQARSNTTTRPTEERAPHLHSLSEENQVP